MSAPESEPTLRGLSPGMRVFSRYVLQRMLGRGGMGEVWLATDEKLGGAAALKFIADQVRWDPASLDLLKQETNRSRVLGHPHILRIHDFVEDAAHAAIAMEYLPGGSLHQLRARQTPPVLTPDTILRWLPGVCAAIDYAHAQKIVHRDLKPGNLLIAADGAVKIADFGIAQPLLETSMRVSQWQPAGTLVYMSPQQHFGEPARPSDDIYALGATLYELLTGKPPFYAGNLAAQIERRRPDSIAERRRQLDLPGDAIPRTWEDTIAACLAKRPEERPKTATEAVAPLSNPVSPRKTFTYYVKPGWSRRWFSARRKLRFGVLAAGLGALVWMYVASMRQGVSDPSSGFPSDTTRAYAAWNLDGTGRDASGRGLHLDTSRVVPAPDRHGRIDRAVYLNGNSALTRKGISPEGWGGSQPFAAALWVKPASRSSPDASLLALRPDRQDDFYWSVGLNAGRLHLTLGRLQVDAPDTVMAPGALPAGRWCHVAASSDGHLLRLYVDGREVAVQRLVHSRRAVFSSPPQLYLGHEHRIDPNRLVGAMDEVRLWQRALHADEVARLAASDSPPNLTLTAGVYPDTEDLPAAVAREFGPAARVADWSDLKRWHADDVADWADEHGLTVNAGSFLILNQGRRFSEASRHYFVSRFDGKKPDYFKVHEELGGMTLALGSWFSLTQHVLVKRPFQPVERRSLQSGPDGMIRHIFPNETEARAASMSWWHEMRRDQTTDAPTLVLMLHDGRKIQAVCRSSADGLFTLALGDATRPGFTRQFSATYDNLAFTVVVKPGRLDFRAVTALGSAPLFQETVEIDGLTVPAIGSLQLSQVDSAELTVER